MMMMLILQIFTNLRDERRDDVRRRVQQMKADEDRL
jgi:hypothetical protein